MHRELASLLEESRDMAEGEMDEGKSGGVGGRRTACGSFLQVMMIANDIYQEYQLVELKY